MHTTMICFDYSLFTDGYLSGVSALMTLTCFQLSLCVLESEFTTRLGVSKTQLSRSATISTLGCYNFSFDSAACRDKDTNSAILPPLASQSRQLIVSSLGLSHHTSPNASQAPPASPTASVPALVFGHHPFHSPLCSRQEK
jgi:hypothetical protein